MQRIWFRPLLTATFIFGTLSITLSASAERQLSVTNLQTSVIASANAVTQKKPTAIIPPPPNVDAKGYVLMDANSGRILAQKNMNDRMAPASLTKLMTMYVISEALAQGQLKLTDDVRISPSAWQRGGSRMFVKVGSHVPANTLIQGIIVASGNDACVAMAEFIAGTEGSFAQLMNMTATRLGMKNTHYTDSTGLPSPDHYSSPYDIALLTRHIINDFPEDYKWYSQKWIAFNNIKQPNRNRLLWRDKSVDGLKTGHTEAAGFCLTSSAKQNGTRLISVVMGAPSDEGRSADSMALFNWGFRFFKTFKVYDSNQKITQARVYLGTKKTIDLGLAKPLYVTIPNGQGKGLNSIIKIDKKLKAPISAGEVYGHIEVTLFGTPVAKAPLVALQDDQKGSLWTRFVDRMGLILTGSWF